VALAQLLVGELVLATKEVRREAVLWLCCFMQWRQLCGLCQMLVGELVLATTG
jgi:hypothetical protein